MKTVVLLALLALVIVPTMVVAVDFNQSVSVQDKANFDEMLSPVLKIYNFIKYAATAIAVVCIVFAGITLMISGNDQAKREQAKMTGMYIIIGLVVIWVAPLIVQYVAG